MTRQPKRIPGEPDPKPEAEAPGHVAREAWMAGTGANGRDYGIARGIFALRDWARRRKALKARGGR